MDEPATRVNWLTWSNAAFARARSERMPVLLALGTSWCQGCAAMARTTYAEPAVSELISERFVPIWVDADRRPDINERYNLGAWPTTAFLTPNGHILGGETYVEAERMIYLLRRVADAFAARHEELEAQSVRQAPSISASAAADPDAGVDADL